MMKVQGPGFVMSLVGVSLIRIGWTTFICLEVWFGLVFMTLGTFDILAKFLQVGSGWQSLSFPGVI